jgi:hypothetical protein
MSEPHKRDEKHWFTHSEAFKIDYSTYAQKHHHHHHPRCYNPCRDLADLITSLQPSLSMALVLQFLIPSFSAVPSPIPALTL